MLDRQYVHAGQLHENIGVENGASGRQLGWSTDGGLQLDVVHDSTKGLGTLLHLRQFSFAQFLADEVRDALLANAHWNAEENLFRDAVPAFRQRAQREHTPLFT